MSLELTLQFVVLDQIGILYAIVGGQPFQLDLILFGQIADQIHDGQWTKRNVLGQGPGDYVTTNGLGDHLVCFAGIQ